MSVCNRCAKSPVQVQYSEASQWYRIPHRRRKNHNLPLPRKPEPESSYKRSNECGDTDMGHTLLPVSISRQ